MGALQRQRKVDLVALVESTMAAVTPLPGTQTTAFANYLAFTGQKLSPPAAFKWHALVSLRDEMPVADGVTPQRTQDTRAFPEEALAPGTLTFMDLGYTDTGRFLGAIEAGARFLVRLKDPA